jgi:putative ATPase
MSSLFEAAGLDKNTPRPLADRLRPQLLEDVIGQEHLLGPEGPLKAMVDAGRFTSLILWGPPGTGKTTIARLIAQLSDHHFEQMSAIFSGVQDLRKVFDAARARREEGRGTLLFIDEIHRFNRAQQDGFLPHMEEGTIILIGATTENPSFELNGALLSRAQVLTLKRLEADALSVLMTRAEEHEERKLPLDDEARQTLISLADGDGRYLLTLIEQVFISVPGQEPISAQKLIGLIQRRAPLYDKSRDEHYNIISALHKSVRGSDPDAALYWLARMLVGGEGPLFIARRLVRMAVEDIGLADPQALVQANAAREAYEFLGSPEGELALAQATVYLATAPKSNRVYTAFKLAMKKAKTSGALAPPAEILNAPTKLMKEQGYGAGYIYDHDTVEGFSGQDYFPSSMGRQRFYDPVSRGFERDIQKRLSYWGNLRGSAAKSSPK